MEEMTPVPQTKKRKLWLIPLCCVLLLAVAAAAFFLTEDIRQYQKAQALYAGASYSEAAALYESLGDYRDSAQQARHVRYQWAGSLREDGNYADALELYEDLGDYLNSQEHAHACAYELGLQALDAEDLEQAVDWFAQAGDYSDAAEKYLEATYNYGHGLFMSSRYEEAQACFDQLADYPQYNIPHFAEPQDAIEYLKTCTNHFEEITVVVQHMHPFFEKPDYWNAAVQQGVGYQFCEVTYDESTQSMRLKPSYYPGQRIVWAWESGDFSALTQDEQRTYEKAMEIVAQAKDETEDDYGLELWLHDWICDNVEYDSPVSYVNPEDFVGLQELTCVGTLLNGTANCQGYTDAFYLLGTLAGLEVQKVYGANGEEGHCWNVVRLDDRLYTVDVTFNDTYWEDSEENTYIWFNNALDINEYTVNGGVSQFDGMVILNNLSQTYYAHNDMVFDTLEEAMYQLLLRYQENEAGMDYAVVDIPDLDNDDFYDAVSETIEDLGIYYIEWCAGLATYKEDTYITVRWN